MTVTTAAMSATSRSKNYAINANYTGRSTINMVEKTMNRSANKQVPELAGKKKLVVYPDSCVPELK